MISPRSRRLALLVGSPVLAVALLAAPVRPDASASPPRADEPSAPRAAPPVVRIDPDPVGPRISMGYDLKQPGKARSFTAEAAADMFGSGQFSVLRLPVFATQHPAAGRIEDGTYDEEVAAAGRVARGVTVFGSLRLRGNVNKGGEPSLPRWAKRDGHVNPRTYGRLLFDYLRHMDGRGVEIDVLGPDNERRFNDADMTPQRYVAVVKRVRALVRAWNDDRSGASRLVVPTFVAAEEFAPDAAFLTGVRERGGWGTVDHAGTHYYSKRREEQLGQLRAFARVARRAPRRPIWDTEFHYNDKPCPDRSCDPYPEWVTNLRGVLSLADNFTLGVSSLTWWAYTPSCTTASAGQRWCDGDASPRSRLQRALVATTARARAVRAPKDSGRQLTTRAFTRGDDVFAWLVNDTDRPRSRRLVVDGFDVPAGYAPTFERLSKAGRGATYRTGALQRQGNAVAVPVPARSVVVVSLPGAAAGAR